MNRPVDVLLVDDNQADVRLSLLVMGEEINPTRVRVARDGEEALDFILHRGLYSEPSSASWFRLILLDLKLPKVSGFDVLARIKSDPRAKVMPVVVLSSSKQDRDIQRSYELGANSYLQKPVIFEEFRALIRRAVQYWLLLNEAPVLPP
jgi:two-component system response regulator